MANDDRLNQAHQHIQDAVRSIVTGDQWAAMLDVAARFHNYSHSNIWLILHQRPDATQVAGFHTWRKLGRWVRKGERGIAILAPLVTRGRPVNATDDTDRPQLAKVLRGFRVVYVWDLSQTDGADLPDVTPTVLAGDDPDGWFERLTTVVQAAGFVLERRNCRPANGQTDHGARTVTVRPDLSPAQAVKTLSHELGHVLLHNDPVPGHLNRAQAEVEAESVAYLVCHSLGILSDDYSFPYLARWSGGDVDLVRRAAERSIRCARRILTDLGLLTANRAA